MQRADIALYEAKKWEKSSVYIEKKKVIFRNKLLRFFLLLDNRV